MELTLEGVLEVLSVFDDPQFTFDEPSHTYRYGNRKLTSITTHIKGFSKPFDSDYWSARKAQETGVPQSQLLAEWKAKADYACGMGTEVHLHAEHRMMRLPVPGNPSDGEVELRCAKFDTLYGHRLARLIPVAAEKRIFNLELGLSGTIDNLSLHEGRLYMIDWKTNGKLGDDNGRNYSKLLAPFADQWENEMNKYSIQLSYYAYMLSLVGLPVEKCMIGYLPPGDAPAQLIPCKDYTGRIMSHHGLAPKL